MRRQVIVLAAAIILAPLDVKGADLVVWWEEGFYPEEDEAVREIIAAFEQAVWGVGLAMSPDIDTQNQLEQFQLAYEAPWLDRDRHLQVDDPRVRAGMVKALKGYTLIWRKGCTPPDSTSWTSADNNKAFLAQTVVMTANPTLSIPAALRTARPDDYYKNVATIDWPDGANDQPLVIDGGLNLAVVFNAGSNPALASDFVRFLAEEGWLAHWLDFSGDRWLPPMRKLVEQQFWLDTSDPHRMRAAVQMLTRAHQYNGLGMRDNEVRSSWILEEEIWGTAVHRVAAEGISPEEAVDDAIALIKEILAK